MQSISKNVEIVKFLAEEGHADVYHPNMDGYSSLPEVILLDNDGVAIARFLVAEGKANMNLANNEGDTPLHDTGCLEIAKILLEEDHADLNATNSQGDTPLHKAIGGSFEIATSLTNTEKDSQLHRTTDNEPFVIARFLVFQAHANVNATNNQGDTQGSA